MLAKSPIAAPAPRNSDGGFSPEGCNVDDPTTGGCITAAHPAHVQGGEEGRLQPLRRLSPRRRSVRASQGPRLRLVPAEERLRRVAQPGHPRVRQQPDGVPGPQRRPARRPVRHLEQADLVPGHRLEVATAAPARTPTTSTCRCSEPVLHATTGPRPIRTGACSRCRAQLSAGSASWWPGAPGPGRPAAPAPGRSAAPAGSARRPASPGSPRSPCRGASAPAGPSRRRCAASR